MPYNNHINLIIETGTYFLQKKLVLFTYACPQNTHKDRYRPVAQKWVKGDPIDVFTGQIVEQRTDFTLGQTIPLSFTRTWARQKSDDFSDGLCGHYWVDNFSEYAQISQQGQHIQIATAEGTYLQFSLPKGAVQSFNPDHPEFTLNRHRDYLEIYHRDSRISRFFAITTTDTNDHPELGFANLQDGRCPLAYWRDEFDNQVAFIYQNGRLQQIKHSDGIELQLVYQGQWLHQIFRTDQAQKILLAIYQQDQQGRLIEADATLDFHLYYDYDQQHNLTRWSDRDKTWVDYHYDEQQRCIHSIGAEGYYPVWFDYQTNRTVVYDSQNQATIYDYDPHLMQPLAITSPNGAVTTFHYDPYGNLLQQTLPDKQVIAFEYLEDRGLVTCFTNELGYQWHYQYNDNEQLTQLTDPLGRCWTAVEQQHSEQRTTLFTAPDGSTTEFTHNQFGLLTQIKSVIGQSRQHTQFVYDPQHRLIEQLDNEHCQLRFGYNHQDQLNHFTNGRGYQWRYQYNPRHKLSRILRPNQSSEQQEYDRHGNLIAYIDANGTKWQLEYGAFDLLIAKTDGEGNRWRYEYDKDSLKLKCVINPAGERYTYQFNAEGQIVVEQDFAQTCWHYEYDSNGRVKHLINGEQQHCYYQYDACGQLIQLMTSDDNYRYQYDAVGRITAIQSIYSQQTFCYDVQDRVIKETQNFGEIHRTYDDEKRIMTRQLWLKGQDNPIVSHFHYNALGELIALDLPEQQRLQFHYDANGNEIQRTSPQGFILNQHYDEMDCLLTQRAGYEPRRFFDSQELRATGIPAPSFAEIDRTYGYDKALNTLACRDKQADLRFKLNKNYQITEVYDNQQPREAYHYDSQGYLTQRQVGQESYGLILDQQHPAFAQQRQMVSHADIYQAGNQLYRLNNQYYRYDKAGRLISKTEQRQGFRQQEIRYRWNGNNQLISLTNAAGETWFYKYDNLGRRISKECPAKGLRTEYLWDGDELAFSQQFKQDKLISQRHCVFYQWQLVAQQDYYQQTTQSLEGNLTKWVNSTSFAVVQPNGKVLGLLDPTGKLQWQAEAQSLWGLTFSQYSKTQPLDPQLLFAGQYYDPESGLAYNRFRYYDPETACYLCSDPIGLLGGETPYSYVANPLDWVDWFGLAGCKSLGVKNSGHHVPSIRKSKGRSFEVSRNDKTRPTLFPIGKNPEHSHWRLHNAERAYVGPRQGSFNGTDKELFDAYRKSYANLNDIRVDVRSPNGAYILGKNVTPYEAVNLIENWLISKGLYK